MPITLLLAAPPLRIPRPSYGPVTAGRMEQARDD